MNKKQKEIIVEKLEENPKLWNTFSKWLDKQELDIEFVLYEDEPRYFQLVWKPFIKQYKKKHKNGITF